MVRPHAPTTFPLEKLPPVPSEKAFGWTPHLVQTLLIFSYNKGIMIVVSVKYKETKFRIQILSRYQYRDIGAKEVFWNEWCDVN